MPTYDDRHFSPPAPVVIATVRNAATGARVPDVQLLIDTGADVTLLPRTAVDAAAIELLASTYELVGFSGPAISVPAVDAELAFVGHAFRGRFLVTDEAIGILGRDILNRVTLHLDGPGLSWDASVPKRDT
jgi:predicted aspartyl protease